MTTVIQPFVCPFLMTADSHWYLSDFNETRYEYDATPPLYLQFRTINNANLAAMVTY